MFKPIFCWIIWKWEEGGRRYRRGSDRFVLVHRKIRFRFVLVHRKIRFVLEEGGRRYRRRSDRFVLVHRKIRFRFVLVHRKIRFVLEEGGRRYREGKIRVVLVHRKIEISFIFSEFILCFKVLISSLAASNSFRKTRIASFLRLISSSFSFFSFSLAWFLGWEFAC